VTGGPGVGRLVGCKGTRWAVVLSLLAGCRGEGPGNLPNDSVWLSPHFAFHSRAQDTALCPDLLTTLEQHFYLLQGMLGFVWPSGHTIHYYKFVDRSDYVANAPCPHGSAGCADGSDVYSSDVFQQHELVHAYLWPFGLPPPLVAEGTAVALACNRAIPETPSLSLADAIQIHEALADTRVYDTGGRLVRYLLDYDGPEAFMRFYSGLGEQASFEDLDRTMRKVFGAGADEIWAAALETHASCPPPFACSRDALPGDGTPVPVAPICGLGKDDRTFALASDGDVALTGPVATTIGSCDPIPFSPIEAIPISGGASHITWATAGRSLLRGFSEC